MQTRNTVVMHGVFGYVVVIVGGVGVLIAFVALIGSGRTWDEFQSRGMVRDGSAGPDGFRVVGGPGTFGGGLSGRGDADTARAEQREEIRQMLEARNLRRIRRGEEPVDIDAELARLEAGGAAGLQAGGAAATTRAPGAAGSATPHRAAAGSATPHVTAAGAASPAGAGDSRTAAAHRSPELLDEVRALVEVRNRRRVRRGEPALDVEAEVARELRLLDGDVS